MAIIFILPAYTNLFTSRSAMSWIVSLLFLYNHHHHVVPQARISLTLSRHFSLSFIASGRSSGQNPVYSHSCWSRDELISDVHMWPGKSRTTNSNIHSAFYYKEDIKYLTKVILSIKNKENKPQNLSNELKEIGKVWRKEDERGGRMFWLRHVNSLYVIY